MRMSNDDKEWKLLSKSFQKVCLDMNERQEVLGLLQANMSKKKNFAKFNFHLAPILSMVLFLFTLGVGGYYMIHIKEDQFTSGGAYATPRIPVLSEMELRLSQDQINSWLILNEGGVVVGKLAFCEGQCDKEFDPLKVMEERTLKGLNYPTTLYREHVKSMNIFQTQHFIMNSEDGEPFAYLRINVPAVDHELEQGATVILESFQNNLR